MKKNKKQKVYLLDKETGKWIFLGHFRRGGYLSPSFRATECSRNRDFVRNRGVHFFACNMKGTACEWRTRVDSQDLERYRD